ncbi:hypothetical protein BOTBODRAFT_32505 [Botryobasidium botryosum FD-172 SS1]|uniref:Major facilitator superfamily (MFS) profile domain-containing protein n=1 Tax=Botryobasidium botryosum (strain FD-172 SS1) TaxID=930990 RepID=A0A067MJ51_BOTB1|nr:hypothetical protein BOTBODRAFT_32505 [Botryobasidium botryosum FD-172 SS1]
MAATHVELTPLVRPQRTPLPKFQLMILCLTLLSEPVAYTQIFPYVNQMMEELHVTDDPSQIGFYSGLVDSSFAIAQLFMVYRWGKLSDRIGRRPVMFVGLFGAALSSLCIGLSTSLWSALLARSLGGFLSGNGAVIQSMIGELTDDTNIGQAAPLTGACWAIGAIIGPLIGGTFSNPVTRFPNVFGDIAFLKKHPYFLPCFISTSMTLTSITIGYFFLEETLPSKAKKRRIPVGQTPSPSYGSTAGANVERTATPPKPGFSAREIFSQPAARSIFFSGFMVSFLGISFDVVFALFAYTQIDLGGIQRTPAQIGYWLSASAAFIIGMQLFVFPVLQRRFHNVRLYTVIMSTWIIAFAMLPLTNLIARGNVLEDGTLSPEGEARVSIGIVIMIVLARIATLSFSLNVVLVKSATPDKEKLGSMYGISQSFSCAARAIGPAFVSSFFAWSVKEDILGGYLVWVVMMGLATIGALVASNVQIGSEVGKVREESIDEAT